MVLLENNKYIAKITLTTIDNKYGDHSVWREITIKSCLYSMNAITRRAAIGV